MAGRLLELFGRRESAIGLYQETLQCKPQFKAAENRMAYLLAALGRLEQAQTHFQAVLQSDPANAVAHFNLGYVFDKRGRFEQAIESFQEAVRLNPKIDRAWYGLGMAHAALHNHEEAAKALHAAATELARRLAADPDTASRWVGKDALRDLSRPEVKKRLETRRRAAVGR